MGQVREVRAVKVISSSVIHARPNACSPARNHLVPSIIQPAAGHSNANSIELPELESGRISHKYEASLRLPGFDVISRVTVAGSFTSAHFAPLLCFGRG